MQQWHDSEFARRWAERNAGEATSRRQSLDLLLKILADFLAAGTVPPRVLDLGCGPGLIASRILDEIATSSVVGVDGSAAMLELARERLAPYPGRFSLGRADFDAMTPNDLAGGPFGAAIAVQAIHNCSDAGKQRVLRSARAVLAPGGLFLLLDRIRLATPALFSVYRGVWDQLGPVSYGQHHEGATYAEHVDKVERGGDLPGSLEQNLLWLREAGFAQVAAVHVVGVRALIAGT
jgi:SAM-dependent methyltransferase